MKENLDIRFVEHGSREWHEGRALRHKLFYQALGHPQSVMDDDQEHHSAHLVVQENGKVIGYGRLFDHGAGEFQISQMAVDTDRQGRGIGKTILNRLISQAFDGGAKCIWLNARVSAVKFYEKAGFRPRGKAFPSEKTGIPHIKMNLTLDAYKAWSNPKPS
jgi:hypothetical protein